MRPLHSASLAVAAATLALSLGGVLGAPVSRAMAPGAAPAATPTRAAALGLSVIQVSDSALTLDSNSPATAGPHTMYVSYAITNTSGASLSNLSATIGGFSGAIVLSGGQAATQYIGTLAAGQTRTLFWFITYGTVIGTRQVLTVSVSDGAGGTASGSGVVRTESMISAQAGGQTTTATIGAGAVVGQLINLDVGFTFHGWKAGDTFDLQPAGNTDFPAGCFQLVSTTVLSADAPLNQVMVPGTPNTTYFSASVSSGGGGSAWNVSMRYTFRYQCSGTSATPLPYSNELSGSQLKYAANYGSGTAVPNPIAPAPSPTASFTFGKSAAAPQLPSGGTETYTVAITNISTFDVTVDSIRDVLPAGVTYVGVTAASGVTAANSGSMPASGATGAIVWRGNPGTSYAIAAGATLNLVYTTTVTSTAGQYVNAAGAYVGSTSIGSSSATVTVGTADLSVSKSGPSTAAMQDTLKYLVTATNAGPSTAYQVIVRDTLPSGVTFVRATNGGTYASGVVTWPAAASLALGGSLADSVIVLAPNSLTTLLNKGAAASASYDPAAANNNGSAAASQVSTTLTLAIDVTPDGPATPVKHVPGKYSQPYTVSNVSVFGGSFALNATVNGATKVLAIDSIAGSGITTRVRPDTALVSLAAHSSATYTVWYTIPVGDTVTAVTNTEVLRARSATQAAITDTGWVQIRRSFPTLAMTKAVTPTGVLRPGTDLTYTMTFSNNGEYDATAVVVSDIVPPAVYFKVGSISASLPGGITATVAYSSDGGSTWTYAPVSGGGGAPVGYDANVNRVRWTLSAVLPPSATASTVGFVARIR